MRGERRYPTIILSILSLPAIGVPLPAAPQKSCPATEFVAFRSYVEEEKRVGTPWFELIWDKAILFTCVACNRSHFPVVAKDSGAP